MNEEVRITQVSNGFIVHPSIGPREASANSEIEVYQSFDELVKGLSRRFEGKEIDDNTTKG